MIAGGNADITSGLATMVLVFYRDNAAIDITIAQTAVMNSIAIRPQAKETGD